MKKRITTTVLVESDKMLNNRVLAEIVARNIRKGFMQGEKNETV